MSQAMTVQNVWILSMEEAADGSLIAPFQGDIEIAKGEITAVTAKHYDSLPSQIALPGLINTHGHAAMCLFRGYGDDMSLMRWLHERIFPVEAKLTPEDIYAGSLLACAEMLKSGTTTFADMYFCCEQTAQAVTESGIRASIARGLTPTPAGVPDSLVEAVEFALRYRHASGGRITTMLGPHAPYTCDQAFLTRVAEAGRANGIPLHIHLLETQDEVRQIEEREGCRPVEFLQRCDFFRGNKVLAAHCVWLTAEEIAFLQDYDVSIAHNPVSNLKLASGIAPVPELLRAGLNVALGTDSACSNNNLDMFEELKLAALVSKVRELDPLAVPATQALKMATVGGAQALGLEARIGTLSPGKQADLILVNLQQPHLYPRHDLISHLVYAASGADVDTVIVAGELLMQHRQLRTLDEAAVMAQAEAVARRLCD